MGNLAGHRIEPVTVNEFRSQLKLMRNRKAPDAKGVATELLKDAGDSLSSVLQIFSEILKPDAKVAKYWRETQLNVLFKKGDPLLPGNYRPIATIPILYKLFSRLLCSRVRGQLESQQSVDQAGFRSGFSCDDNNVTIMILSEMHKEVNIPLGVAAVDFQKPFDTVHHGSLWRALYQQGVPHVYIDILQRLYEGQTARMKCDCISRDVSVKQGTKQGDPISPLLFNSVLEDVMRPLKAKWTQEKKGVPFDHGGQSFAKFAFCG